MNTFRWTCAVLCLAVASWGCDADSTCNDAGSGGSSGSAGEAGGGHADDHADPHNYGISMEAGHIHAWREAAVTFAVRDMDDCTDAEDPTTCTGLPDLPLEVLYRHIDSSSMRVQEIETGALDDNGDGTYTWTRHFSATGAYAIGARFEEEGHGYSAVFPLEVSRAGGERIFCPDADAPDFAYQIRWENSPGHIHAEGEDVTFSIELMRSFGDVDTEQPWTNTFDHLAPSDLDGDLVVEVTEEDGTLVEALTPTYEGRGIYTVVRAFDEADLGGSEEGVLFALHVAFTDDQGCSADETGEDYTFEVVPGH